MEYSEYAPAPTLAPFVERIWTLTGHAAGLEEGVQPVLPDGRPELVLHLGDPFDRLTAGGAATRQARILFAGQLTEQLTLRPVGAVCVVGVRFHAFGASAFLAAPQHELAGLTLAVEDLSLNLARALRQVCEETDDVRRAAGLVQRALAACVRAEGADARVVFVTRMITESGGAVAMDALAQRAALSRRHLERLFLDTVGIPPKRLARITRFQRALTVLERSDPRRRGVITAAACGYADQSHFIREFRELAGCSPAQHLMRRGELTGFFVTRNRRSSQKD